MRIRIKNCFSRLNSMLVISILALICISFVASVSVLSSNENKKKQKAAAKNASIQKGKPKLGNSQTSEGTNSTGIIAFHRVNNIDILALSDVGGANDINQLAGLAGKPVFSPDGNKILFRSLRNGDDIRIVSNASELYLMTPTGYNQTRITTDSTREDDASFSADGTQIVFLQRDLGAINGDIWKMNADGTNPTLLADFEFQINRPLFSPDGTKIVFSYQNAVWLMDADGSNQFEVNTDGDDPTFTPNGTKIIFRRDPSIYSINLDGSGEAVLIDGGGVNYRLSKPVYSPTGTKILLECADLTTSNSDICVADANGTGFQHFGNSDTAESFPVWSPDALRIAYISFDASNLYEIVVAPIDGGSSSVVYGTLGEQLEDLSWQPVCTFNAPIDPTGLVSWWRGENNADDSLGVNNGTFQNGAVYGPGKIGEAFQFVLNGNFVEVPDSASLNVQTSDYTLAAWVKINSSREHFIAGKGACGGESSRFYMGVDNENSVFLDISNESGGIRVGSSADGTITIGQWHHLVMRKQGSNFKLFQDASLHLDFDLPFAYEANNAPFTIGKGDLCTPPQLTSDAAIDEVYLFNRALSGAEVSTLYNGNNTSCPPTSEPPVQVRIVGANPVAGGRDSRGEIRLAENAPVGGVTVNLTSSDLNVITVPSAVFFPENSNVQEFSINTGVGSTFRSADVIANVGVDTARATASVAPSAPDLAGSNLNAPATVNILEDFTASWTITNNGEAATGSFIENRVYVSPDNQLFNGNDTIVAYAYDFNGVLNPGQSRIFSVNSVNIPSSAIPVDGTYYLFVYVGINVNERGGNSEDNYISIPIQVNRNLPDLVAENIVAPAELEPGVLFTISWDVRNAGSRATPPGFSFSHDVFFSFDGTVGNADDIPVTFRSSPPLGINQSDSYSQQFSIPTLPVRPSSDALIYVKVDTGNLVFEGDPGSIPETNNTTTLPVRFEYRVPDLQVQSVTPPAEVESDTQFAIAWTTTNAGNKNAAAFNERVFFSTDNIVNANDVEIGSFALPGGLNAGQSINRIQDVTIPTNAVPATGDYFVYVKTDADGVVNEGANENNNVTFQAVRVRRLLRPDLVITNITAPASAFFGQDIQIQFTISNNGIGATNVPFWNDRVYLGLNQTLNGATPVSTSSNISSLNPGESYIVSVTVKVPRGFNGSYYVIVKTDINNAVSEENENNNLSTRPITLNIPPLPDLRVSNVQAPADGFAGQPIAVSWTVTNNGNGATPANEATWTDAIYLSQNTTFDGGDRLIGTRPRSGVLALSGSYTVSNFSVNLPQDVFGPYYVFILTDNGNQVYEFNSEGNNADYDQIQPGSPMNILGTPPDLTISGALTAPSNEIAGNQITVSFIVKNQGAFDAVGSWWDSVFISADQTFDPTNDTFLGSSQHTNLAAGQQYVATYNVRIPSCLDGTYYLFGITDINRQIFEFDPNTDAEANNTSQPKAVVLTSLAPDLRVTQISVPPIVINGSMPMTWTVKNVGASATIQTTWHDQVLINTGSQLITLGIFERQGGLAVNAEYTQNQVVHIPFVFEGSFQIVVRTDSQNVVPECSNDQNNDDFRPVTVQQNLPDLRITGINSPGTALPGSTINVTWTGQNFGTAFGSLTSWADTLFLSADTILNPGDQVIGNAITTSNLAAGATYNVQTLVSVPNVPVGSYFLIASADTGNNVSEGVNNESNNSSASIPITITAPQVDLQVTNVSANPTLYCGQFADISWTTTNSGSDPTFPGDWTNYIILSRDSVYDPTDQVLVFLPNGGVLNGGTSYSETRTVQIPNGLTGDYNIFVLTDRHNNVVESNENNNLSVPFAVNLQLPPPAELNITNITPPSSITLGDPSVFTWTVQNSSANSVNGTWQDSIYLSTDTTWDSGDMLIGQKQRTGTLASFATYTETLDSPIPPVETGTYYVIVRTDARNTIRESNESNNVSTSVGQTTVSVPNLTLGTPLNTTLVTGQERFFSILNTPIDETMLVGLTGQSGSSNELYTRYGSMVSRANYEFQGDRQGEADQVNVVPNTKVGSYYTMVRGDYIPGSFAKDLKKADEAKNTEALQAEAVTLKAELLPFGIRTVSPGVAGNNGYTFISIDGAKFQDGASVKLVGPSSVVINPIQVLYIDKSNVKALFDLNGKAPGDYQVVLTNPNSQSTSWSQTFRINNGGGPLIRSEVVGAGEVSIGRFYRYIITTRNEGTNDALNVPILVVLSQPLEYRLSTSNILSTSTPGLDPTTLPVHFDVDGKRVLLLFAPVVRSNESVNIGIDIKFGSGATITATTLPPIFEPNVNLHTPFRLGAGGGTDGVDLLNCFANLLIKGLLTALSEIIPADCAYSVANALLGLVETGLSNFRGGFDVYSTMSSAFQSAINIAGDCAKNAIRYIPWIKFASLMYDIYQLTQIALECVQKTFEVVFHVTLSRPIDPNEKLGPLGFGPEHFVPIGKSLLYRINFENLATATAPAQKIRIVDQLPPTLDPRTVRLVEIGFKQNRIVIPDNRAFYQTRLQLGPDLNNLQADVSAGLDVTNGRVTWNLTAIDPQTNEQPLSPSLGLLPPNNAANDGQGYVVFTIAPTANQVTRTDLANNATIFFDNEEPISTNTTTNLLDADLPVSQCASLPATSDVPGISISWAGSDDPNGSGLSGYDVFVSENGNPYFPFITNTTTTSATFTGKYGRTYSFFSVAHDNAGNVEAPPVIPDATIRVLGGMYESDTAPRPEGDNDGTVNGTDVSQIRRFAAKLDTDFQYNEFQRADSAPRVERGNGTLSVADVIQANRFALGLDVFAESAGPNIASLSAVMKTIDGKDAATESNLMLPRELRVVGVTRIGNKLIVAVRLEAQGDETGVGFTMNYDTAVLSNPANILAGADASGASITANTSQPGSIGIIVDKLPNQSFAAGTRQLLTLEFDVLTNAASTLITFGNSPVTNEVVDGSANSLTTAFTTSGISLLVPTSANVPVGGRVRSSNGNPLRQVTITLTDEIGNTRMIRTGSFGYYRFDEVEVGRTYVISAQHSKHQFVQPTLVVTVNDAIGNADFVAIE